MQLEGKTALVTGASRGLGRGIALVLAEQGAGVVVNYRRAEDEAQRVVEQCRALGVHAVAAQADVARAGDVDRLFDVVRREFGRLDILVNNAGTSMDKDIFAITEEDWDFILDTNLKSCFLCSKSAMEMIKAEESGSIVNISSVVAQQGALYGHIHYAATKSGMLGLTKTLARTAAPLGIRVNAVAPGVIETDLLHRTLGGERVDNLRATIPLGLGTPRDVGLAVAFLCGEGGRYITGATLDINGGLYLR
jgi:NAD(P)-dependent dehydrogenase (short-subunit alcohol dehydrogenase family)